MQSIKWLCFRWPWVTPNLPNHPMFAFFVAFHIFILVYRLIVASLSKPSLKGAWLRHMTRFKFWEPIHISGMAESRALKFCTKGDYILPKGWQITPKRGVVLLTWSIFVCTTVELEKFSTELGDLRSTVSSTTDYWLSHLRRSKFLRSLDVRFLRYAS